MSYKVGGHEEGKGSLDRHKKIDDSVGMCGSESDYDSCWNRMCSPDKSTALRDVLRGLLVLIALAIVVTIVFLLCFFLLNDIEQKEEELVDTLIKDFSTGNRVDVEPELSFKNEYLPTKYRHDSDALSEQERKKDTGGGARDPSHQNDGSERSPDYNAEDDLYLTFGGDDSSKVEDSEIANTEGSFVNAFAPADNHQDISQNLQVDIVAEENRECVPLRLPLCSSSMPWTVTSFPNFVKNNNLDDLKDSLMYFQSIIVGSRCSPRATEYTCAILEPTCGPDGILLPPCKAFCKDIVKTCSEFLIPGNEHNIAFECDRFPDSRNPNVCVDITATLESVSPNEGGQSSEMLKNETSPKVKSSVATESSNKAKDTAGVSGTEVKEQPEDNLNEDKNTKNSPSNGTDPPVFICDHTKFLCDDGSDCLGEESVCDGVQHCLDNSDELNCTQPEAATFSVDSSRTDFGQDEAAAAAASTVFPSVSRIEKNGLSFQLKKDMEAHLKSKNERASLSEILSTSALVGTPKALVEIHPSKPFPNIKNLESNRGKDFDSRKNIKIDAFSPFGSSSSSKSFIAEDRKHKNTPKLSLASLLSSSVITPTRFHGPQYGQEEQAPPPSQRTLSALLSSALPSLSPPSPRTSRGGCSEFRCLGDGSCISIKRLNDGIRDCRDGSDERNNNHIRLK